MKIRYALLILFPCSLQAMCNDLFNCWDFDVQGEIGYRKDHITHNGPLFGSEAVGFCQDIQARGLQATMEGRLTLHDRFLLKMIVGGAGFFNGCENAFLTFPFPSFEINTPLSQYEFPTQTPQSLAQTTLGSFTGCNTTFLSYCDALCKGYGITFDISAGAYLFAQYCFDLAPRFGYALEYFNIGNAAKLNYYGPYVGFEVPIYIRECLQLRGDVSYLFHGARRETEVDYTIQTRTYECHPICCGIAQGWRFAALIDFAICECFNIGFEWKYLNFNAKRNALISISSLTQWQPDTRWKFNQYLFEMRYSF